MEPDRIPLDAGTTRPAMGGEIARDELVAEIRSGLEGVTPGPWQVIEDRHPWRLEERPQFGLPEKTGEHTERRIFTTWIHGQSKAPWSVVGQSAGITVEPGRSVQMVHITERDAAHIARMSPDNVAALLARLDAAEPRGWQPIKTAPRDGRWVWLWNKHVTNPADAPQRFKWSTSYSVFGLGGCWTEGFSTMGDGIDFDFWCETLPADFTNPYAPALEGGTHDEA